MYRAARIGLGYNPGMRPWFVAAPALVLALASPAAAAPPKLTLDEVIAKTLVGPRVRMAAGDAGAAAARVDEANAARYPRVKATAFGTASPDIRCLDATCTMTDPQNFAFRFSGVFAGAQVDVVQPVYTFGKIDHARRAASAARAAHSALAEEAAGDLAVDAARAYWGVKLARELGYMLDDGIDELDKAIERMERKDELSVQDRQRIGVLLAEARVQRADAAAAETQALAGLRALTGVDDAEIDDDPLAAIERPLPQTATGEHRPQAIAAQRGAEAADQLAEMAASQYWPDLAVVGVAGISRATGVEDPPSVFAFDPFNRPFAGLVLALQWTAEPWNTKPRVARARAEARKAHAQRDLATAGARYDAATALAEATAARAKVTAAAEGEKAGRAWVASVLQADAVGTAEAKDLADAYLAWFQIRARWAASVFQWNVAVVRLGRAAGEFQAGGPRR